MGQERYEEIGRITHYYSKISVAVITLHSGTLKLGDTIRVKGITTDFTQKVESMEIQHQKVAEVKPGQSFGLKVAQKVREGDKVYKLIQPS